MFFAVILIVLIFIVFRKQEMEETKKISNNNTELVLGLLWFLIYFILSFISNAFHINIINEITNWLFFVLFPLFITTVLRKEKAIKTLKKIGLKRFGISTVLRILLICILYQSVILLVFSLGEEHFSLTIITKMLAKFPIFFCLMIFTAAFTEEFFFRGIIQRTMMDLLKQPYIAILLSSILFGLYHFPFSFYLWDETAGSIINSLKTIMMDQAFSGFALGLIYYKSNNNLWSSIILHAFINAAIMALGIALSI